MDKRTRYSPEVRERAVRMVHEQAHEHASQWAAIRSIATKIGCYGRDAAAMGAAGGARWGPAPGPDDRGTAAAEGAGAGESGAAARERDPAQGVGVFRPGGARPPRDVMVTFIDAHRDDVRSRADLRGAADRSVDATTSRRRAQADPRRVPARAQRDARLAPRDPARLAGESASLRGEEGLEAAEPGERFRWRAARWRG